MHNGVPRILIIRLSAIGDVVRVLPALHALREHHPHAQIDWAVEAKSAGILEDHPALDDIILFNRPGGMRENAAAFIRFLREIRANRYDIVLDFHGILKSGLAMAFSRATKRIAFAAPRSQEGSALFATERVKLPSARMNRMEENLELVKALGVRRGNLDVIIPVAHDIQDEVDDWLADKFHGGKRIVAVHAPVDRPEKQWPLENYAALADMFLADGRFEVLLTWGPGQEDVVERVRSLSRRNPEIAPETSSLKHLAWLLSRCDLLVGGDTGPMHIASAMGTPIVALFGGTDPAMHNPMRQPCAVLYRGPDPPLRAVDRVNGQKNMMLITPREAYDAAVALLKSPGT